MWIYRNRNRNRALRVLEVIGTCERLNAYGYMLWLVVLAASLLRRHQARAGVPPATD